MTDDICEIMAACAVSNERSKGEKCHETLTKVFVISSQN